MEDNNTNLSDMSVSAFEALTDKSEVNILLEFVKPSMELKTMKGEVTMPSKPEMVDYTLKEVIFFKNCFKESEIDAVLEKMYNAEDFSNYSIFSLTSVVKWVTEQMTAIIKNEERISSSKDKELWKAAGIERMGGFGEYVGLYMLTQDITKEDQVLSMPYYRIFDYMEISKVWGEVQGAFQKLKSKQ